MAAAEQSETLSILCCKSAAIGRKLRSNSMLQTARHYYWVQYREINAQLTMRVINSQEYMLC
eukprot:scaffold129075_cov46-Prasinocladus_malaysianus.AAC.1